MARWTQVGEEGGDSATIKSAARAFAVLELFERRRGALLLMEIAAALSLPTSSAAALLKTLVALGYLEYDRSRRRYGPTMRIAALGRCVESSIFGDGAVLEAARRLHAATGLAAVVAVQSDLQVQYLHLVHRGDVFGAAATPGARRPLTSSAFGLALLSGLPSANLGRLLRRINYGRPQEERVDAGHLRVALHEVRANGFAFTRDLIRDGHASIAVFVPKAGGGRPLALGLSGGSDEISSRREQLVEQLTTQRQFSFVKPPRSRDHQGRLPKGKG